MVYTREQRDFIQNIQRNPQQYRGLSLSERQNIVQNKFGTTNLQKIFTKTNDIRVKDTLAGLLIDQEGKAQRVGSKLARSIVIQRTAEPAKITQKLRSLGLKQKQSGYFGVDRSGNVRRITNTAELKQYVPSYAKITQPVSNAALSIARATKAPQTIVKNGAIIKVSPNGTFERIGFTKEESERRNRINLGVATAKDVIGSNNVKLTKNNINRILNNIKTATIRREQKEKRISDVLKSIDQSTKQKVDKSLTRLEKRAQAITKRGEKLDLQTQKMFEQITRGSQSRKAFINEYYNKIPKTGLLRQVPRLNTILDAKDKAKLQISNSIITTLEGVGRFQFQEFPKRFVQALDKTVFLGEAAIPNKAKNQYSNYIKELLSKKQTTEVKNATIDAIKDPLTYVFALMGTVRVKGTKTTPKVTKNGNVIVSGSTKTPIAVNKRGKIVISKRISKTKSKILGEIDALKYKNELNKIRKNTRNNSLIKNINDVNRAIDRAITFQQQAKGLQTKILSRGYKARTKSAARNLLKGKKSAKQRKLERKDIIKIIDKNNKIISEIKKTEANERAIALKKSENLIRNIRQEIKAQKRGKQPKSVKIQPVILGKERVYPFFDPAIKQTRYFKSRNLWKKAIVQQARKDGILSTEQAIKAISTKKLPKIKQKTQITKKQKTKNQLFEKLKIKKKDVILDLEKGNQRVIQTKNKIIVLKVKEVPIKTSSGQVLVQKQYQIQQIRQKTSLKTKLKQKTKKKSKQTQKQKLEKKTKQTQKQYQLSKLKLSPKLLLAVKLKQKQIIKQKLLPKVKQKQNIKQIQRPKQIQKTKQVQKQQPKPIKSIKSTQIQKISTKQAKMPKITQKPTQKLKLKQTNTKKEQKTKPKIELPQRRIIKNAKAFNVWVRSQGRWLRANPYPVAKSIAARIGRYVADNSTSATFIVLGTTGQPKPFTGFKLGSKASKFRNIKLGSKLPTQASVEKRRNRIDTLGEKRKLKASRIVAKLKQKRSKKRK